MPFAHRHRRKGAGETCPQLGAKLEHIRANLKIFGKHVDIVATSVMIS